MDAIRDLLEWLISAPLVCCSWIVIGALAGAFARRVMGAKDKPLWNDMLLGLVGAIIGGFLTSLFSVDTSQAAGGGALANLVITFVIATAGAAGLIFIGRTIFGDERKRRRRKK